MKHIVRLAACVAIAGVIAACTAEPTSNDSTTTTLLPTTTVPTTTTEPVGAPLSDVTVYLEPVGTGFQQPILTLGREGDDHLFVVDQDGLIHAIHWLGPGHETTFPNMAILDLSSQVDFFGERGLLGAAFHPDDPTRLFVHYSRVGDGATVVEEYRLPIPIPTAAEDLNQLTKTLLVISQPAHNHNGGSIEFGPDGSLYIALGDGGGGGDPLRTGQDPGTPLGSILRIDVDGDPYAIPADNPFADGSRGAQEVWAYGLRNPWRISFDGDDLWVADVGQGDWEEINRVSFSDAFGANFGWSVMEGTHCYGGPASLCDDNDFITPVLEYPIRDLPRCAVMGGYVYRGTAFPDLTGVYLYADHCTGELFGLRLDDNGTVAEQGTLIQIDELITSLGRDAAGELFVLTMSGSVYLVTATAP
ncbi:MAG TPA: PQQ-dependent sugar dehydrogenase [Acidimicrobiia bacterium]|nr:PQQ-dependent sugar dehydrogenase [Acidimicrobiia bacterium]